MEPRLTADRERMVCPNCGYVHYVNPIVAAGCLVIDEGRVLLVRRGVDPGRGKWGLPVGYAEAGERPEETAVRETLEETGLHVEIDDFVGVYTFLIDSMPGGVAVVYAAHAAGGTLVAGADSDEARYFRPEDLPEEIAFKAHRRILGQWARAATIRCREATAAQREYVVQLATQQGVILCPSAGARAAEESPLLVVALDGGEVVGYLSADDAPTDGVLTLRGTFVLPDYRRWGIGTRLLENVATMAAARGARSVLAEVSADNPGLLLFTHAGFQVRGFRPDEGAGTLILLRDLTV